MNIQERVAVDREIEHYKRLASVAAYRNVVLTKGYQKCLQDLAEWSAYASPYFAQKHNLNGTLEEHKRVLGCWLTPPDSKDLPKPQDWMILAGEAIDVVQGLNGKACTPEDLTRMINEAFNISLTNELLEISKILLWQEPGRAPF